MLTKFAFNRTAIAKTATATLLVAAASTTSAAPAPAAYTVMNFPVQTQFNSFDNRVLNERGQVTGRTLFSTSSDYHAFRLDGTTLIDLGTLGLPYQYSAGIAINASGQVTGAAIVGDSAHAFIHDGSSMRDLGLLSTEQYAFAAGRYINDSGQVVGEARIPGNNNTATNTGVFLHDGSSMRIASPPFESPFGSYSSSRGIGANGQVAGTYVVQWRPTLEHAFFFDGVASYDIGSLSGDPSQPVQVSAMNASGQLIGNSFNGTAWRAFLYEGGVMKDFTASSGLQGSTFATDIHRNGDIIGYNYGTGIPRSFIYSGGQLKMLGSLSTDSSAWDYAKALNGSGHAVGIAYTGSKFRAFIYDGQSMVDLNTRLINAPGVEIEDAFAISDSGYIVARTSSNGYVLLKPAVAGPSPAPATLGAITANDPVPVGSPVNVSAPFSDVNTADTHTAIWTWEGNGTTNGTVTEASGTTPGSVTGSKTFTVAGVYNVTVEVADSAGLKSQVARQVVVYDPSAGFVTGGGWINSPAGAYKADAMLAGKANFGFVSKYLKGANKPSGETEFQFQAAKLNFQSNNYDWLVVGGARAQYKGVGTINGAGSYQFMLTAIDGDLIAKGTPDRFRMKIWHYDEATTADVVDYDNQITTGVEGSNLEGTMIGGGSISIKVK